MARLRTWRWSVANAVVFVVIALAYSLLALSAYELFGALSIGVTFFPPAGLTFASFLLLPRRVWPAVALAIVVGEVAVDLGQGQSLWWSLGWSSANLTEPFVGALVTSSLVTAYGINRRFALAFFTGGLVVGPACGAAIGATVLMIASDLSWLSSFPDVWVGDALGVLVVAPVIFVLLEPRDFVFTHPRTIDIAITAVAMVLASVFFVYADGIPVGYAALPLLVYPAVRCSSRELSVAAVVVAGSLTAATARGAGPWGSGPDVDVHTRLVQQQAFLLAAIGSAWLLKLEVLERVRAVMSRKEVEADLVQAREETKDKAHLAEVYRSLSEQAKERAELDHQIALTLQNALMPGTVSSPLGLRASGRYVPAARTLEVGGDWYELICTDEGGVATVVIGDVVGHSLAAAAAMGQLAAAARALACAGQGPAALIENLDLVADRTPDALMATLACATLHTTTGHLRYSSAGHPPPCVRHPDGTVAFLEGGRGTPLAISSPQARVEDSMLVQAGSLVVFYTDGLVERRDRPIDERLEHLREVVGDLPTSDLSEASEALLREMVGHGDSDDDVALLLLAFDGPPATPPGAAAEGPGLQSVRR